MAKNQPDVLFAKIDVDELGNVAQKNGITAMPTFIAFRDGKAVGSVRGADPRGVEQLVVKNKFAAQKKEPEKVEKDSATGAQLLSVLKQAGVDTRGYLEKHELLELAEKHHLVR
mmetsp:Transcript_12641/g.27579  ORF Transcript_12641/g.27579 Transcript_12641/m.27579 type:complete len:114 (+) Transcript_12641:1-342(+)